MAYQHLDSPQASCNAEKGNNSMTAEIFVSRRMRGLSSHPPPFPYALCHTQSFPADCLSASRAGKPIFDDYLSRVIGTAGHVPDRHARSQALNEEPSHRNSGTSESVIPFPLLQPILGNKSTMSRQHPNTKHKHKAPTHLQHTFTIMRRPTRSHSAQIHSVTRFIQ